MVQWMPRPTTAKGQVIRVLVNLGAQGLVDTATMIRRGAAIVALCDVLASIGKSVEIVAVTSCNPTGSVRGSSATWSSVVTLKQAGMPYDRGRLLFALAHPSMHRRIVFGVRHQESAEARKQWGFDNGGMGSTAAIPAAIRREADADVVLAEGLTRGGMADPAGWVIDQLEGLNLLGD
jgi:hypothetical protein